MVVCLGMERFEGSTEAGERMRRGELDHAGARVRRELDREEHRCRIRSGWSDRLLNRGTIILESTPPCSAPSVRACAMALAPI